MKNILVGNGINIQYDNTNYTTKNIVLRMLTDLDSEDYTHIGYEDAKEELKRVVNIEQ